MMYLYSIFVCLYVVIRRRMKRLPLQTRSLWTHSWNGRWKLFAIWWIRTSVSSTNPSGTSCPRPSCISWSTMWVNQLPAADTSHEKTGCLQIWVYYINTLQCILPYPDFKENRLMTSFFVWMDIIYHLLCMLTKMLQLSSDWSILHH